MDTMKNPDFPTQITRKIAICTPQYIGLISRGWTYCRIRTCCYSYRV